MTIGAITVVDVAGGVPSLSKELKDQRTAAASHGEKLLVETTANACGPCQGLASSLGDPQMQQALDRVRIVRIDCDQFEEDLDDLEIPSKPCPGFFLLDPTSRSATPSTATNGTMTSLGISRRYGPFVRGTYTKRRVQWRHVPRPSGTVM